MVKNARTDAAPLVVIFDGVCNLCNARVNRVIERDPGGRVLFLPLQSKTAKAILNEARVGGVPMNLAWSLPGWIPVVLPDLMYRAMATSGHTVFGRQMECRLPTPELKARFLDPGDVPAALAAAGLTHRCPVEASPP
jgi:predicted DCC family thiol-disulfide oxidoreductase YuxK